MARRPDWPIVPLDMHRHERREFACGDEGLDRYLKRYAGQDIRRDVARIFVASPHDGAEIMGYYTLSATSFGSRSLRPDQARKLPRYPVPSAILGRLAVATRWQGQGLGERLLIDALDRVLAAATQIAVQSLIVDAKSPSAARFYARYGFQPFIDDALRPFLPLASIRQLRAES